MVEFDTRVRTPQQLLLRWGPVVVWASRGVIDPDMLGTVRTELAAAFAEHPQEVVLLVVSSTGSELGAFEMRRSIADTLGQFGDRLHVAAAFEGGSWWVNGARKLVDKILAQVPSRQPVATFGDRESALLWLEDRLSGVDQRPIDLSEVAPALDRELAAWQGQSA